MTERLRRGLGLLVVAVISWLVFYATQSNADGNIAIQVISGLAGAITALCLIGGLVTIAIALLRPLD